MKLLTKWTCFLNRCFDFGKRPLTSTGGFVAMVGVVLVITLLIVLAAVGGPEQLPGT